MQRSDGCLEQSERIEPRARKQTEFRLMRANAEPAETAPARRRKQHLRKNLL